MKPESKSAPFLLGVVCFSLVTLSGCADIQLPSWLTGETPAEVLAAPRAVRAAPIADSKAYPNLASVPNRVPTYTPQGESAAQIEKMKTDRARAGVIKGRIEAEPAPEPWPLPPPTVIGQDSPSEEGATIP